MYLIKVIGWNMNVTYIPHTCKIILEWRSLIFFWSRHLVICVVQILVDMRLLKVEELSENKIPFTYNIFFSDSSSTSVIK